jgi:hypothetical protein
VLAEFLGLLLVRTVPQGCAPAAGAARDLSCQEGAETVGEQHRPNPSWHKRNHRLSAPSDEPVKKQEGREGHHAYHRHLRGQPGVAGLKFGDWLHLSGALWRAIGTRETSAVAGLLAGFVIPPLGAAPVPRCS